MFIYRRAFRSFQRMAERNPGMIYFIKLYIDGWIKYRNMPDHLKKVTEDFYKQTMKDIDNAK